MDPINILEARNNLSRLVTAAGNGEEVVIANRGKPVARLVAIDADEQRHTAGRAAAWLTSHRVPAHAARDAKQLDEQIALEREGWV